MGFLINLSDFMYSWIDGRACESEKQTRAIKVSIIILHIYHSSMVVGAIVGTTWRMLVWGIWYSVENSAKHNLPR